MVKIRIPQWCSGITYIVNDNQICYDHADVHITVHSQIRGHVVLGKTLGSFQDISSVVYFRPYFLHRVDFGSLVLI